MGYGIESGFGRAPSPGSLREPSSPPKGCNSHTDTDHCQLRIGTTLSRVVTSAL